MWNSSHLHGPRRLHEQSHVDLKASRSSSPDDGSEPRRRTSSDATPRQTTASTRFLTATNDHQDTNRNLLPSASTLISEKAEVFGSSRRLGFFADKLTSSLSGTAKDTSASLKNSLHPSLLLHPYSHSRAESGSTTISALSPGAMSTSSILPTPKSHTSPSKASYRTYDSKLVSREMHRLGNLAHHPSALTPQLSTAPSVTTVPLPPPGMSQVNNVSSASTSDPWGALHVHVLPLFNGEPLSIPIEELNKLVKRHIQVVVSLSPSKALVNLENDASELIASGMVTLNAKLKGIDDEKLVARVVEIWGFFWDQVLTYLEGVLLPLQTDPLLLSLSRTPKSHRPTSPNRQNSNKVAVASVMNPSSTSQIDVRSVALKSFRDRVILPPFQRLFARLSLPNRQDSFQEAFSYQQPRLQQMLLVLSSQSRQLPVAFSLTTPTPQPTAGEAAIKDLLRLVRSSCPQSDPVNQRFRNSPAFQPRTPTFLSGGIPRDRRGRIAQKGKIPPDLNHTRRNEDLFGEETPRKGPVSYVIEMEREREREMLEALRSPDIELAARESIGGWGLGGGHDENARLGQEEEEDEPPSDWDQAQVCLRLIDILDSK
ncbi:HbrB-domain-containing protein [Phlegmacium glaucopus]|nr:HbrB-domain-containing protein [Phlegmacium glaucopus]